MEIKSYRYEIEDVAHLILHALEAVNSWTAFEHIQIKNQIISVVIFGSALCSRCEHSTFPNAN